MNSLSLRTALATGAAIIALTACVYRMDISQGSAIETAQLEQLKVGMSKSQVRFLLGSPEVVDLYKPDLWHYVYYAKMGDQDEIEKNLMTLKFSNDLLTSIEGGISPD